MVLDAHYSQLQRRWRIAERMADYAGLVTPTGNDATPFHRWFRFKEGYSQGLLERLFKDASWAARESFSLVDPFLGSGTTLLSALEYAEEREVRVLLHGVERNPVMHAISESKVYGRIAGRAVLPELDQELDAFWTRYRSLRRSWKSLTTPSATLNNPQYFPPGHVRALIAMSRSADQVRNPLIRSLVRASIAASVEMAGHVRRDGRALRYSPNKPIQPPAFSVTSLLEKMREDLQSQGGLSAGSKATITHGDARSFEGGLPGGFDWAVFSPPYPNNIDYTEVYKAEAWALGFFDDASSMRSQRLSTLRSHPSIRFPDSYAFEQTSAAPDVYSLIRPLLAAVPSDRYTQGRLRMIRGYADDMYRVLMHLRRQMSADGYCAIVVGNSAHGHGDKQFIVASDLVIAGLAELTGWAVEEIRVARYLTRRAAGHEHVRESVIMLRVE